MPPLGTRAWRLLGCVLLFEIGTGMTLPIAIVFLHEDRGLSLAAAGFALAAAGAAGLVGTVAAGVAADRFGAGLATVSGLALAGVGTLAFLAVHSLARCRPCREPPGRRLRDHLGRDVPGHPPGG